MPKFSFGCNFVFIYNFYDFSRKKAFVNFIRLYKKFMNFVVLFVIKEIIFILCGFFFFFGNLYNMYKKVGILQGTCG